jgi:hypothetical protein
MVRQINIDEVLLMIQERAAAGRTFAIGFVRATGDKKGSIKLVVKARYGGTQRVVQDSQRAATEPATKERKVSLHIDAGTLPLTDTERNRYFTPLIRHIVGFDGMVVIH